MSHPWLTSCPSTLAGTLINEHSLPSKTDSAIWGNFRFNSKAEWVRSVACSFCYRLSRIMHHVENEFGIRTPKSAAKYEEFCVMLCTGMRHTHARHAEPGRMACLDFWNLAGPCRSGSGEHHLDARLCLSFRGTVCPLSSIATLWFQVLFGCAGSLALDESRGLGRTC